MSTSGILCPVCGPLWAYGITRYLQEVYWSRDDGDEPGGD